MDMPAERPLRVGKWSVDALRNEISFGASVVALEPRTMRLLLFLAKRPGEVVSIDQILKEVWAGVIVTSESVYQAIGALRRALGDDSRGSIYIATVPRRGYRLVAPVTILEPSFGPTQSALPPPALAAPPLVGRIAGRFGWPAAATSLALAAMGLALAGWYFVVAQKVSAPLRAVTSPDAVAAAQHSGNVAGSEPVRVRAETAIVVLPFLDLSEKQHEGYLANGMAEELIVKLARIGGLRVVARTSALVFNSAAEDVQAIAAKLGVDHVLEGSIQRSGEHLRITTKLIRASDSNTIWAETFDRETGDLFTVQDDISSAVANALKLTLVVERPGDHAGRTHDAEAHLRYLLGRELMRRGNQESWRRAVDALHKAIELDPGYAESYAALVDPLMNLYDQTDDHQWLDRASADAERAIVLEPGLADGYAARGNLRLWYQFDWAGAHADFEKALSLNPGNPDILVPYGYLLASQGLIAESIGVERQAAASDPLSANAWRTLGYFLIAGKQYSAASDALSKSRDIDPRAAYTLSHLGLLELVESRNDAALGEFRQVSFEPLRLRGIASAEYSQGHAHNAETALTEFIRKYHRQDAYQIGETFAWRGQTDQAFKWFYRAYAQRDPGLVTLKIDPLLSPVRADARYHDLLAKLNLPP